MKIKNLKYILLLIIIFSFFVDWITFSSFSVTLDEVSWNDNGLNVYITWEPDGCGEDEFGLAACEVTTDSLKLVAKNEGWQGLNVNILFEPSWDYEYKKFDQQINIGGASALSYVKIELGAWYFSGFNRNNGHSFSSPAATKIFTREQQCTEGMNWWRTDTPLRYCAWDHEPYDNTRTLEQIASENPDARKFLKMTKRDISRIPCTDENKPQSEDIVRWIQRYMQWIWEACSTCEDWKLWQHTLWSMANCLEIICQDPYTIPSLNGDELTCEDENYEIWDVGINGATCCKKKAEITISEPRFDPQENWDFESDIYVYFSVEWTGLKQSNLNCDTNNFSVDWWEIRDVVADEIEEWENVAGCTLHILANGNSVTVSALAWIVQVWDKQSSALDNTYTKEDETESETSDCGHPIEEGGDCQDTYWWYFSFDSETNCCVQWWCNRPANDAWECDDEWYANDWNWCCSLSSLICTETQYSQWWNCVECTWDTIPNASRTKCICDPSKRCCWIQLNMSIPFIWDCIENESDLSEWTGSTVVNSITAFPILMQWMMKLVMSLILVVSFLLVIVSGLMMTAWAFKSTSFDKWKTLIKNVIISLILLWLSWLILKLINPNFFGG